MGREGIIVHASLEITLEIQVESLITSKGDFAHNHIITQCNIKVQTLSLIELVLKSHHIESVYIYQSASHAFTDTSLSEQVF